MTDLADLNAKRALEVLEQVQFNFDDIAELRRQRMLEAVEAGNSLRQVADVAHCSYESVRRVIEPQAIILEWNGGEYLMAEHVTRVLEYKASGYGRNAFPADVERIGAGTGWLPAAAEFGRQIQRIQRGESDEAIALTDETAYALFLILTLTYTGRPSRLADLFDDLSAKYRR